MTTELDQKIDELFYIGGFNCAETTLCLLRELGAINVGKDAIRLMTGFGGGMARGDLCGSVVAAVAALGSLFGRDDPAQPREPSKARVAAYLDRFIANFGSVECRQLTSGLELKTEGQYQRCAKIIGGSIDAFETAVRMK